jgi:hypothetical protein
MEPVVDDDRGLSPTWLTDALRSGQHDHTVTRVSAERVGTGQMGTTYRLTLDYLGEPGPKTLIAKVAGPDEALRAMVASGYAAEVGFYRHLAPSLTARIPRCWYAAITEDRTRFTLLLEDAAPAKPGVQADGCTLAQARSAIASLVQLHAPRWGDRSLTELGFLMRPGEDMAALMQDVLIGATEGFLERYESVLADEDPTTLRAVAQVIGAWQLTRLEPSSVVHGDYRLDNLLFHPDRPEVVAVDWQSVAVGPPLRDVAYFLGTSITTDDRRAHEREIVREYHAAIVECGVVGYDLERCWDDYRLGHLQGPMIGIIGCMYASGERSDRSDAMFTAMVGRSCAAIRDLGSLDLL